MNSVFENGVKKPDFEAQNGDVKCDVLVIGGGICGILCAHMLSEAGVDTVLCEADEICGGTTRNTTAKITSQHGLIYDKIIRSYGENFARGYLNAQTDAMKAYKKLAEKIPCDYIEKDFTVYSRTDRHKIEKEILALEKLGCKPLFTDRLEIPVSVEGALTLGGQAEFNPLKLTCALAAPLRIFEHTRVIGLEATGALTSRGRIYADKIIVATHFPFLRVLGGYFLKMYQHRSYVIALEGAADVAGMYVDENEKGLSFRTYNELLLIGGGGHRTGRRGGGWRELWQFAKENYPRSRQVSHFATQDCITLDSVPYIGRYSLAYPNLYVATGFNKWGMTSSMVSAILLTDLVLGRKNDYAQVFSPRRSVLHPKLLLNAFNSAVGLLTPTVPRCTHLGCALKYNRQEHTWDCSCHGSRFTERGELIDSPANKDMPKEQF